MKDLGIYKFNKYFGRSGNLSGIFVQSKDFVDRLIGCEVYFGEVLGKHSEVYGEIESEDLVLVTENEEFIKLFQEYDLSNGYNPFDYTLMNCEDNEEDMTVEEIFNQRYIYE